MMPLSRIFFLGIVFYLLYRFIFNFFLPIFKTTKEVRQQFKNMQDIARDNHTNPFQQQSAAPQNAPQSAPAPKKSQTSRPKNTMGEYIDFEEIK